MCVTMYVITYTWCVHLYVFLSIWVTMSVCPCLLVNKLCVGAYMLVFMLLHACVCIHGTCIPVFCILCIYVFVHEHACMCVRICKFVSACLSVYLSLCVRVCVCVCVHLFACLFVCMSRNCVVGVYGQIYIHDCIAIPKCVGIS